TLPGRSRRVEERRPGARRRAPSRRTDAPHHAHGQRHGAHGRPGRPRDAAALRPPERPRPDRDPLRVRPRAVRGLHRPGRRAGDPLVRDAGQRGGRAPHHHDRGARDPRSAGSRPGGLHRRAGRAVRLLHGGARHDGARLPRADPAADGGPGPGGAGRPSLPVREPPPGDPGRAARRRGHAGGRLRMAARRDRDRRPPAGAAGRITPAALERLTRRGFLCAGGALVVALGVGSRGRRAAAQGGAPASAAPAAWPTDRFLGKTVAPDEVDAFVAIHPDGTVTLFTGKVDIGTGGRAALRQMLAEDLDVAIDRITTMVEGDTALTPDQGPTAGSQGISRGGQELRRAAATARAALLALGARRLGRPVAELETADGTVRPRDGGPGVTYGDLIGDRRFGIKVDPKAPLRSPAAFRWIGRSVPRPDVPAKVTGRNLYVQDLRLPGMLHARVIRPPAAGATLVSVDEGS